MSAPHFVAGQSFTKDQLAERNTRIGASDVPAILGLDKHRSPLDVYLTKRGLVPPFEGNTFTEWGLRIEPVIRAKFAELRQVSIELPGTQLHPREPWASCTPDGICTPSVGGRFGLEIKNKSVHQLPRWGATGTDEIPHEVAAQVHFSMVVTGLPLWSVAALFGGNEDRYYDIPADPDIAATILDKCRHFWKEHVEKGVEPPITGGKSVADYLRKKFAAHGEAVRDATHHEDSLIAQLHDVRTKIGALEEEESVLVNHIIAAIRDDAGIAGRSGRVTWKRTKDSLVTDWNAVALALNTKLGWIGELLRDEKRMAVYGATGRAALAVDLGNSLQQAKDDYTKVKPGSRRFLPTFPKGA